MAFGVAALVFIIRVTPSPLVRPRRARSKANAVVAVPTATWVPPPHAREVPGGEATRSPQEIIAEQPGFLPRTAPPDTSQ